MKSKLDMDKEKFLSAYENSKKSATEEPFQWTKPQIISVLSPMFATAVSIGVTNTRKFRMWAHTTSSKNAKQYINISSGLGRRIFISFAVIGGILASNIAYDTERRRQTQKSIKDIMLLKGYDLETVEAKRFVTEYKLKNAMKTKQQQQNPESEFENKSANNAKPFKTEKKLVNLKNPSNWKHWPEVEKDNSSEEGKSK